VTTLAAAIERGQWRLVSMYLLYGVSEAAARLDRGSLEALLDLVAEGRLEPLPSPSPSHYPTRPRVRRRP
jgi:hypothetical protein